MEILPHAEFKWNIQRCAATVAIPEGVDSRFLTPDDTRRFFRKPLNREEKRIATTPFEHLFETSIINAWKQVDKENLNFLQPNTNPHHSFYGYRPESSKYYIVAPQPSFATMPNMQSFKYKIPVSKVTFLQLFPLQDICLLPRVDEVRTLMLSKEIPHITFVWFFRQNGGVCLME